MTVDDETLMAFADGALPAARAAEVEAAVAADPALAAKVARFRAVGWKLRGSLDGIQPPPNLMARAQAALQARPRREGPWLQAVAAGLFALGLAAVVAGLFQPAPAIGPDMRAQGVLQAALDETPSGKSLKRRDMRVSLLYTVTTADGRVCRAFRLARRGASEGAACRDADGWRVVVRTEAAETPTGYGQASDASGEVDAALDALNPSDPLSATAEAALMKRGWRE